MTYTYILIYIYIFIHCCYKFVKFCYILFYFCHIFCSFSYISHTISVAIATYLQLSAPIYIAMPWHWPSACHRQPRDPWAQDQGEGGCGWCGWGTRARQSPGPWSRDDGPHRSPTIWAWPMSWHSNANRCR